MSGLEPAGLALGVIPLIVSGIKLYRKHRKKYSKKRLAPEIDWLIEQFEDHEFSIKDSIGELMLGAGLEGAIYELNPREGESILALRNAMSEAGVQEHFGKRCEWLSTILEKHESCLETIAAASGNPSKAIPGKLAPSLRDGFFTSSNRRDYPAKLDKLEQVAKCLHQNRESLKEIINNMGTQPHIVVPRKPSSQAKRLADMFLRVKANATPLFAAMCKVCTCQCRTNHKVLMRLDRRVAVREEHISLYRGTQEQITFSLVLGLEGRLQEAFVQASQIEQIAVEDAGALDEHEEASGVPGVTITMESASANEAPKRIIRITDICDHAHQAQSSRRVLKLQLTKSDLSLLEGEPESTRGFTASETLEELLQRGSREEKMEPMPKQKTLLALDIAASILQLQQTHWFRIPFDNRGIKFLVKEEDRAGKDALEPFVEQNMEKNISRLSDAIKGPEPKSALIELAILLLEIWNFRSIGAWAAEIGMADLDSEDDRLTAANRWLNQSLDYLPRRHGDAIDMCLKLSVGRLPEWDNHQFIQDYCENIIEPLRENCRAW